MWCTSCHILDIQAFPCHGSPNFITRQLWLVGAAAKLTAARTKELEQALKAADAAKAGAEAQVAGSVAFSLKAIADAKGDGSAREAALEAELHTVREELKAAQSKAEVQVLSLIHI